MSQSTNTTQSANELEDRIVDLESKVAFQDHTIESLNDSVAQQQRQIEQLTFKLNHVVERLKSMQPSNISIKVKPRWRMRLGP